MHARRDQHFAQEPFEADWEPQVAVVKEHLRLKRQLVNCKGPRRDPDKTYLDHAKGARECDLAKMKSESRRDVQFWVSMVNVVKAPEKWRAVVGEMPVVEGQIHEQKTSGQLKPRWKGEKMDKTKRSVNGPAQRPLGRGLDEGNCRKEGQSRYGEIDENSPDHRSRALPQRKHAFEGKEHREQCDGAQDCYNGMQIWCPALRHTAMD